MVLMGAMAKDFSQAVSEGVGWSGAPQGSCLETHLLHMLTFIMTVPLPLTFIIRRIYFLSGLVLSTHLSASL